MRRSLYSVKRLSQKQGCRVNEHFALGAVLGDNLLAEQHCGADVGLCSLAQGRRRVKIVARILGFELNVVEVAADHKYFIGTKGAAVESDPRNPVLGVAPVNKLFIELIRVQFEVEFAIYGVLVDLHEAVKGDRGFEF